MLAVVIYAQDRVMDALLAVASKPDLDLQDDVCLLIEVSLNSL